MSFADDAEIADLDPEFQEILREFRRSLPERLLEIEQALAKARWPELYVAAHRLKGVGTNFGFPEITEMAGVIKDQVDTMARQYVRAWLRSGSAPEAERDRLKGLIDYPLPNGLLERAALPDALGQGFAAEMARSNLSGHVARLCARLRELIARDQRGDSP